MDYCKRNLLVNYYSGYDLESFTAFIGAHYMIFVSVRDSDGSKTLMWKLYNDIEVQFFMDWNEVVTFCLSSKCIPTLLFYEVAPPVYKGSKGQQKDINRFFISRDQFELLQIKVMEQD